jgi:hypothetical protein
MLLYSSRIEIISKPSSQTALVLYFSLSVTDLVSKPYAYAEQAKH